MEAYPLLTKRRLGFFFLEELLHRKLNVHLLELCPMLNPFNNNHCGKKMEDIALRKMYLERMIELNIMHLKRMATTSGRFKYDNDQDSYRGYRRNPVPASEYRKKLGRRTHNPVRLAPHLDHWYTQPPRHSTREEIFELYKNDPEARNNHYWEWEAKTYCPKYSSIPPYGSYDRVQKAVIYKKLNLPHDRSLLQQIFAGYPEKQWDDLRMKLLLPYRQSFHFNKMLREYYPEDKWLYFSDEMRRTRACVTPSLLNRKYKKIKKAAAVKRWKKDVNYPF